MWKKIIYIYNIYHKDSALLTAPRFSNFLKSPQVTAMSHREGGEVISFGSYGAFPLQGAERIAKVRVGSRFHRQKWA